MGVYSNTILADSPIHYWRCFENFGALALEDIGSNGSFLYSTNSFASGAGFGIAAVPGLGWSGVASDGGSMACSGLGFANGVPASGAFPDPPGVLFPVPGTLELWSWIGQPVDGNQVSYYAPSRPAGTQSAGIEVTESHIIAFGFSIPSLSYVTPFHTGWHHAVVVWTATSMQLYVDGSSVLTGTGSLASNLNAVNFFIGQSGTPAFQGTQSGFLTEVAIYNAALGAGQIANHFAAADSRTNQPVYYGTRPATVSQPQGYQLGPGHTGLHDQGSFATAGGTVALLISVTTDTPQHGEIVGNPDYLLSRGYITASNPLGSVYEFNRLVFGTQVRELPRFTDLISWSFPPNLVVSITELFVR